MKEPLQVFNTATITIHRTKHLQENMVFYAFRYCLGRNSYCVSECVEYLKLSWSSLSGSTKETIKTEIIEAIDNRKAGMNMDVSLWMEILNLE